ncbi:hypothetical protein [Streptomyces sp. cg36]|uniref:hypothetical protein n=1 Tax=Streptomyces sp. cg36 TaxID=3238798 RepID=UPI0034E1B398
MSIHPDNILADGAYDERMYDITFEPAGKGRWRVVRGLGNHIGFTVRDGYWWATEDVDGRRFGSRWSLRWVAAHDLSHRAPLSRDADPESFRTPQEQNR